jgi:nitrogen fixation/metabolism regulation signal transduction histidine kinase
VDAGIVRSALTNIIENAVEACRSDRSGRPHEICFDVTQDSGTHLLQCIGQRHRHGRSNPGQCLHPFFSSKGERGTGLGLFISNRILSQHGGGISLESEPEHRIPLFH